jgi:hypothetical protein
MSAAMFSNWIGKSSLVLPRLLGRRSRNFFPDCIVNIEVNV